MEWIALFAVIAIGILAIFAFGLFQLFRKIGVKWSVVVVATAIGGLWLFVHFVTPSDEEAFLGYTQIALPSDVRRFDWDTANYDQFGDHDGIIAFSASADSLLKITESRFKGESDWKPNQSGTVFTMKYERMGGERATGKIDLGKETFRVDYSSW